MLKTKYLLLRSTFVLVLSSFLLVCDSRQIRFRYKKKNQPFSAGLATQSTQNLGKEKKKQQKGRCLTYMGKPCACIHIVWEGELWMWMTGGQQRRQWAHRQWHHGSALHQKWGIWSREVQRLCWAVLTGTAENCSGELSLAPVSSRTSQKCLSPPWPPWKLELLSISKIRLGCLQATGKCRSRASFLTSLSLENALISAGPSPFIQSGNLVLCLSKRTRTGYLGFFSFLLCWLPPSLVSQWIHRGLQQGAQKQERTPTAYIINNVCIL